MSQDPQPPRPPSTKELKRNLSELKALVLKNPADLDARIRVARTLRLLDRPDDAVGHYRSVARYLAQAGHVHLAIGVARELLQLRPDHAETLLLLAKLYAQARAAGPEGRIAMPRDEEMTDRAGLLPSWPTAANDLWRAIRTGETDRGIMKVLSEALVGAGQSAASSSAQLVPPPASTRADDDESDALDEADVLEETRAVEHPPELPPDPEEPDEHDRAVIRTGDESIIRTGDEAIVDAHEVGAVAVPGDAPLHPPPEEDSLPAFRSVESENEPAAPPEAPVREESARLPALPDSEIAMPEIPLFAGLGAEERAVLAAALAPRHAAAGATLWKEGDDALTLVLLARGEAVTWRGEGASRVELARLGPGDLAGVFALISERRRLASLGAVTDVDYLELHRSVVERLAKENAAVGIALREFFRERVVQNVLSILPVFRDLDSATRRDLAGRFRAKRYQDEDELFYEGAEVSGLWILLDGRVRLGREGEDGFATTTTLEPGSFVVSLAGLNKSPAGLAAVAQGAVTTVTLSHRELVALRDKHPDLADLADRLDDPSLRLGVGVVGGSGQLPADLAPPFLRG